MPMRLVTGLSLAFKAAKLRLMEKSSIKIAFQGVPGAYSEAAALARFPDAVTLPCATFAAAFEAVTSGGAAYAMIPVENIIAGRVADVHTLLPDGGLSIIGEHFEPIAHKLLALPGAKLSDIKTVLSHTQGLAQCRLWLEARKLPIEHFHDTAGAAAEVQRRGDRSLAAIASARAGELYGLTVLEDEVADQPDNMTRFLILARDAVTPPVETLCMTTLAFTLRSVPAALYKALGGFATNGVNLTRIESHISQANFTSAGFTIDVEGRPDELTMSRALDDLRYFTDSLTILGTYPQAIWRLQNQQTQVAN